MSRIFICDNCEKQFPEPLDQEMYKDEHGVWYTLDLCAPCRSIFNSNQEQTKTTFLSAAVQKQISAKTDVEPIQ